MKSQTFQSDRNFHLFDVIVSHGQLLIRSQKDDKNQYNIDIIFFGVTYVQIINHLKGVNIKMVTLESSGIEYKTVQEYLQYEDNHIFVIESNHEKFYLVASFFKVFENHLDFNETSLGFDNTGREREI